MDLQYRKILLLIGDVILLFASLFLTVRFRLFDHWDPELFWTHARAFVFLYPFWLIVLYTFDQYDVVSARVTRNRKMFIVALGVSFLIGLAYFYVLPQPAITPKTNLFIHVILFGLFAFFWRILYKRFSVSGSSVPIGLFKDDTQTSVLVDLLTSHAHLGYVPVLLDAQKSLEPQITAHRLMFLIVPSALYYSVDTIKRMYDCIGLGVTFLEPVQMYEFLERKIPLSVVDQSWFVKNLQERESDWYRVAKRVVDLFAASLVLIFSFPLWIIISIAIKLEDHGPLFYHQVRVGKYGKPFAIWKFRSMKVNAEAQGMQWAEKQDPRVTRVGKWLRYTHLDELPQALNIIHGDISFVGPRPERPEFVLQLEKELPHYRLRHVIQPGFTGWAQVRFRYARSVADSREKFEYDLYYIKNRSLLFDGLILLKTARLLFRGE
ncbi:exopolysaccharide biosynthesis polyprenyl glycosylphosphotransferase [Candidatus Uhrbacteria bacterium]|nr:exopolysaccharide biosynthesis polyprenyl glycosylphosphotransferase [Candidatus Uhrbacteria bacterium]